MKIGLIDSDKTNFPNLALMKISSYHKSLGDQVEWVTIGNYDKIYISKVFTFTQNIDNRLSYCNEIIKGGTGYSLSIKLPDEIDNVFPDYSIYGIKDTAYGFLTRGCANKCKWCVVPEKEGNIKPYRDITEIAQGMENVILMDNNILACCDYGIDQIKKIVNLRIKVDFNQGLDARLVTNEIAQLLSKVKWIKYIRFACDSNAMISPVLRAMKLLEKYGISRWRFNNYLLLNGSIESAYLRANEFRKLGVTINPQPYRSFEMMNKIPQWQKDFARWGSKKELYRNIDFKNYKPRKGFICSGYFD